MKITDFLRDHFRRRLEASGCLVACDLDLER
jgi:hypothetical protein